MTLVVQARRRRRSGSGGGGRRRQPRVLSFEQVIKRVADRFGTQTATAWTKTVLGHQSQISESALRSAIASGNLDRIASVVDASGMQAKMGKVIQPPLLEAAQTVGRTSAATLAAHGVTMTFQASHPNVIHFARTQSSELVASVPRDVKAIIREVVARGAERGMTVAEQARAIRQVVGLPPNWVQAPLSLEDDLRNGREGAATSRRLSAATKQQIRSRLAQGPLSDAFIQGVVKEYTAGLIHARAKTIARTETQRAANHGLHESWGQAQAQGVLPDSARRFWLVTPDSRLSPEHAQIPGMNPAGRRIDEPFDTPDGPALYPPSRPNCRCSVGLAFTDGQKVIDTPDPAMEPERPNRPPKVTITVTTPITTNPRPTVAAPTTTRTTPVVPTARAAPRVAPPASVVTPTSPVKAPRAARVSRTPAAAASPAAMPLKVTGERPAADVHAAVEGKLRAMGIIPRELRYDARLGPRHLQGQVLGMYEKGVISLNPRLPKEKLVSIAAHEATHLQFDVARTADATLARDVQHDWAALQAEDGVTSYSADHWQAAEDAEEDALDAGRGPMTWQRRHMIPVNETLAEIRAMEALGRTVGTERYHALLDRVDRAYKKAVREGGRALRGGGSPAVKAVAPRPLQGKKARDYLDTRYGTSAQHLSETERDAYEDYQLGDYITRNELLRKYDNDVDRWLAAKLSAAHSPNERRLIQTEFLTDAKKAARMNAKMIASMKKMPALEQPVVTYRAMTAPPDFVAQLRPGAVVTDKGFISTTTEQKQAKTWLRKTSGEWQYEIPGAKPVVMEIHVPAGTKAAWLDKVSPDSAWQTIVSHELLLPPGTKFRVLAGSTSSVIKVEVLP